MQGSNITLQQALEITKSMGSSTAISADRRAVMGLWRTLQNGKYNYNTRPPAEELINTLNVEFVPGASLAFIPDGSPFVTNLYNSFVLFENLENPQGWTPSKTIIDRNGNPISETSTTGQTISLQGQGIQGIGQLDDDSFQLYNGNGYQVDPALAFIPPALAASFYPYVAKAVVWIGGLTVAYFLGPYILPFIAKVVFSVIGAIAPGAGKTLQTAVSKLSEAGLLLPLIIGGLALAAMR